MNNYSRSEAKIGMIFQDPLSSLNPLLRIEDQVKESLTLHTQMSEKEKVLGSLNCYAKSDLKSLNW